jgi:hypothetical protein
MKRRYFPECVIIYSHGCNIETNILSRFPNSFRWECDSKVGIVTGHKLDEWASNPGNGRYFSFFHSSQIGSGANPFSYPVFI